MVITNVTTYLVRPRWGFVKIETDGGLTGWGEAVIEGKAATVLACVEEMKDYLLGADPMRVYSEREQREVCFDVDYHCFFPHFIGCVDIQVIFYIIL